MDEVAGLKRRFPGLRRRRGASPRVASTPSDPSRSSWRRWWTRLRLVLALAAVGIGCYSGGRMLADPERFPLRHVQLEGERHNLEQADLQRVARQYLGENFFFLDIADVYGRFMANPWIEEVAVRRLWPDSIEVTFREHVVFGYWGEDEIVDVNGKRFRPDKLPRSKPWPHLSGPRGHEQIVIRAHLMASGIVAAVGLKVERLVEDERRAWWLQLDNGVVVELGRDDFAQRLQRFTDLYPRLRSGHTAEIAAVDLRYINGFAVRWKTKDAANSAG